MGAHEGAATSLSISAFAHWPKMLSTAPRGLGAAARQRAAYAAAAEQPKLMKGELLRLKSTAQAPLSPFLCRRA